MTGSHPLVFETTHHALWAEEVAREMRLGAEVVPAPAAARAGCDIALAVLDADLETMLTELRERGIAFRIHEPKQP